MMSASSSTSFSLIASLLGNMFPSSEMRGLFIGLDASGKTTILYKMKLGEVITTMPTIGFNVETLSLPVGRIQLTAWDVGGCDKIRPLWRHYYKNTQALFFVVDCTDIERLDESMELLCDTAASPELHDILVVIFLNKADKATELQINQSRQAVRRALNAVQFNRNNSDISSRNISTSSNSSDDMGSGDMSTALGHLVHFSVTSAVSGNGLNEAFTWLAETFRTWNPMQSRYNRQHNTTTPQDQSQQQQQQQAVLPPAARDKMEDLLEDWLSRVDLPDDEFLSQLEDFTLDSWDHYTHLRIAHLLLKKHGRREGMKRIFELIKNFIANSPRTRRSQSSNATVAAAAEARGTTFHETMTYFWVHMVHYAMASADVYSTATSVASSSSSSGSSSSSVVTTGSTEELSEFKRFLLMNPQLCNGGLFLHYYSKQRMLFDPDARRMVLLPDKTPLPSLLVDVEQMKQRQQSSTSSTASTTSTTATTTAATAAVRELELRPRQPMSDIQFLHECSSGRLSGWGHESKLRLVYLLLCCWGRNKHSSSSSNSSSGGSSNGNSSSADEVLLRIVAMEGKQAHCSINYFWVQMVTYHTTLQMLQQKNQPAKEVEGMVFAAFDSSNYQVPPLNVPIANTTTTASGAVSTPTVAATTASIGMIDSMVALSIENSNNVDANSKRSSSTSSSTTPAATTAVVDEAEVVLSVADCLQSVPNMPFAVFLSRPHCQPLRNQLLYEKYYSRAVIDSEDAAVSFVLPDIKQLPSSVHL